MSGARAGVLAGRQVLVTGIADASSLALMIAQEIQRAGADLVCAGLGPTSEQGSLSDAAQRYLADARRSFEAAVASGLGAVPTFVFDASLDASVEGLARAVAERGLRVDALVHAIALDRTIRAGSAKSLLATTRQEFLDCMSISAFSLVAILRALSEARVLSEGGAVVTLSYLGAERVMSHPYRNIGVAKAALERIVVELAAELGASHRLRVNAVRFSPWTQSRAGGAIPGLDEAVAHASLRAPLGNATPESLAHEVVHLLRPESSITGEIRNVDGGYHTLG